MSRIEPGRIYEGGTVVGQTDEAGAFRIELPGGGTYVITVELNKANGSQQPVVIETGQALELARPIRLNRGPPLVPGCCSAPPLPTFRGAARAP